MAEPFRDLQRELAAALREEARYREELDAARKVIEAQRLLLKDEQAKTDAARHVLELAQEWNCHRLRLEQMEGSLGVYGEVLQEAKADLRASQTEFLNALATYVEQL